MDGFEIGLVLMGFEIRYLINVSFDFERVIFKIMLIYVSVDIVDNNVCNVRN